MLVFGIWVGRWHLICFFKGLACYQTRQDVLSCELLFILVPVYGLIAMSKDNQIQVVAI